MEKTPKQNEYTIVNFCVKFVAHMLPLDDQYGRPQLYYAATYCLLFNITDCIFFGVHPLGPPEAYPPIVFHITTFL